MNASGHSASNQIDFGKADGFDSTLDPFHNRFTLFERGSNKVPAEGDSGVVSSYHLFTALEKLWEMVGLWH